MSEVNFSDQNFEAEVLKSSTPVLVDFFAVWCGPCEMQAPIIDEVAESMGEKAIIGKVDTEESPKIAQELGVISIPTLILFKGGRAVETMVGMQPKETLEATINKYL